MYKKAHPDKLGTDVTDEVITIWKNTLEKGKSDSLYKEYMAGLDRKIERNSRNNIKACFFYLYLTLRNSVRHPLSREEFLLKEKQKVRAKIIEFQEKANGKEKGDMQEDKESDEEVKGVEEGGEEAFLIEKRDLDQGQQSACSHHRKSNQRSQARKRSIEESFEKKAR